MAEFLIRVHDKTNPNSIYEDVRCMKRGDVVVVCEDGWPWSQKELTAPYWRIVKVPGMPMEEAQALTTPELGDINVNRMLRRRAFKLDVDNVNLPNAIRSWLADDTRAQPTLTVTLSRARGLKTLKQPAADPNVIG
jgi:hypothetical protein